MTGIWVDTDFGFDDLWALLLLRHLGASVEGVSLVAGNAPLGQVIANAQGARAAYGFDWPLWQGADRPLIRSPETAERILGPKGMRSRGAQLPASNTETCNSRAVEAMAKWLMSPGTETREILALGPLTNLARLLETQPDAARRITRLVWMGGSAGAGNHSPLAEFNALADPEALFAVIAARLPVDIVDLTFCRRVTFGEQEMPATDPLTADLLGGYLDIALERDRPGMAIYDPLAAVAIAAPGRIAFAPCEVEVSTTPGATYGATRISACATSQARIASGATGGLAALCLGALEREALHGPNPHVL